jgi:hypothetical protein
VSDPLLLPEGARLLHIGPQKTGTTAIQVAMAESRDAMARAGAYYPSGDHRRRKAGWALGLPGGPTDTPISHWEELVAEVGAAGRVRVCVSDENFARADDAVAKRIVSELGGDEPYVVAVARSLDRYLPSQWQERVRAGSVTDTFEDWLRDILDDTSASREHANVWMGHDTEALVERWAAQVGPDRVTVVVADESDHRQLLDLFERFLGLPAGTLELHPDRSNEGFGLVETELVRRLRGRFRDRGWRFPEYNELIRRGVQRRLRSRSDRAPGPRHAPLPDWALSRIRELSDRRADRMPALGVRVLGDPDSLRIPPEVTSATIELDELTVPMDLAVDAIEAVVDREHELAARSGASADRPDLSRRELLLLAGRRAARRFRGR